MTNNQYHQHPAVSKSGLDLINRSPAHYKAAKEQKNEPTPAMLFGSLVHSLVFGINDFFVMPKLDMRTKAGKEMYQDYLSGYEASGAEFIVTEEQYQEALILKEAVFAHPAAAKLLRSGHAEQPVFAELEGVPVKVKPDWLRPMPSGQWIVDLKTTNDSSPAGFSKSVYNYRYHVQAAFYTDVMQAAGYDITGFLFLCVEKTAPHCVELYQLDNDAIELGRVQYRANLETFKECIKTGDWYGYNQKQNISILSLPDWAYKL